MARYKADTISQMMGHGYQIRVMCRCGNNATLDPGKLLHARKVGLKTTVRDMLKLFRCKLCRQRPVDVYVVMPVV